MPMALFMLKRYLFRNAYGWKSDLSDEEILEKYLSLNLERGKV